MEVSSTSGRIPREKIVRSRALLMDKGVPIQNYILPQKPALASITFKPYRELIRPSIVSRRLDVNIIWLTSLNHNLTKPRRNWSGFMDIALSNLPHPPKSCIKFLPIIDLNPSDENCIYFTLLFTEKQAKQCNPSLTPCITFDQPLWLKATEIIHMRI